VFENLASGIKPIQIRHGDIQNQKIWSQLNALSCGFAAIAGFATNFPYSVGTD
jgi:hypothetical protein